ncbi:MAG: DUF3568 family protein [Candidatus Omnitrophica bacterium]|nr:DUF3568 family protein [Candidatus Omnitrophota bacterium]
MFKKIAVFVFSLALLLNIYGCVALLAGAAAGTGTAVWLSGKLTQQFNASYEQTISAAERALNSLNLEMTRKVKEVNITQLKSQYSDGKEIWIDIRRIANNSTKVEIRVGVVNSDRVAADKILKAIQGYL